MPVPSNCSKCLLLSYVTLSKVKPDQEGSRRSQRRTHKVIGIGRQKGLLLSLAIWQETELGSQLNSITGTFDVLGIKPEDLTADRQGLL